MRRARSGQSCFLRQREKVQGNLAPSQKDRAASLHTGKWWVMRSPVSVANTPIAGIIASRIWCFETSFLVSWRSSIFTAHYERHRSRTPPDSCDANSLASEWSEPIRRMWASISGESGVICHSIGAEAFPGQTPHCCNAGTRKVKASFTTSVLRFFVSSVGD